MDRLKITIFTSDESWMSRYIPALKSQLSLEHEVSWPYKMADIEKGDIAFFLSCGEIVIPDVLSLNKNNIVVHASKLPQGKGWSPWVWEILQGRWAINLTLFEAVEKVDAGKTYMRDIMQLDGTELIEEIRAKLAKYIIKMCMVFVEGYPWVGQGNSQFGESSYYRKRTLKDSELSPNKTIREQFNLLRVVDNERYPAFFILNDVKYILKIEKG